MKKLIPLLLAFVLLCAIPAPAFAETQTETAQLRWEDVSAVAEKYNGQFFQISETNLKIWVPAIFSEIELTQEDEDAGIVSYLMADDKDAAVWFTAYDSQGLTLKELEDALREDYPDATLTLINDVEAVGFSSEEEDVMCVYYLLDSGDLLGINFAPASDETYSGVFALMICSTQIMEDQSAA